MSRRTHFSCGTKRAADRIASARVVRGATFAVAVFIGASIAAHAPADLAVLVGNGDRVTGRIDPAPEAESLSFLCPRGAKLTVTVKSAKGGAPMAASLRDPEDSVLTESSGTSIAFKGVELGSTGAHRVAVTSQDGATAATYTLTAKWTPRKKWTEAGIAIGPESGGTFTFATERGAKVALAAKRAGAAVPHIGVVTGPDGFSQEFDGPVAKFVAPALGEYTAQIVDTGGGDGGAVTAIATVTSPKAKPRKVDITTAVQPDGAPAATIGVVGAKGTNLSADDPEIGGTLLAIPGGASAAGTVVFFAAAGNVPPISDRNAAGPAVEFGPDGLTFAKPVTITLPFDSAKASSAAAVAVLVVSGGTTTEKSDELTVNVAKGTVSFPTSHFSTYQVVAAPPPPDVIDLDQASPNFVAAGTDGTAGGTFVATRDNLASFTLTLSAGSGSGRAVLVGTTAAGTPVAPPVLWSSPVFTIPAAETTFTFHPNRTVTPGLKYAIGFSSNSSLSGSSSGFRLHTTSGDQIEGSMFVSSPSASVTFVAAPGADDIRSRIVQNGGSTTVEAYTETNQAVQYVTQASGPRTIGGTFVASRRNLVSIRINVGPNGGVGDMLGIVVTDAPAGVPGSNILFSQLFVEPAFHQDFEFTPVPYTVDLVPGATYFIGVTIDGAVVPGASGDSFELNVSPGDPIPGARLFSGDALPIATPFGQTDEDLSVVVVTNDGDGT